jgi:Polyketide cyclase / dehydrase and lipid transport
MATTSRMIDAGPAAVYAVLANGWSYGQWVVGTSHVRAVAAEWPAPGSRLHHAVGPWPLVVRDHTEVRESEPGRRLLLTARGWPFGEAEIDMTLEPEGEATRMTIREEPIGGPGALLRNRVADAFIHRRNIESLERLAALAEQRTVPPEEAA